MTEPVTSKPPAVEQSEEHLRYALLLDRGTRIGLAVLVVTFAIYVLDVLQHHVPVQRLPQLWGLSVERYLEATHSPTGWGWLWLLHRGDILGMVGIVILAGCSVVCLLALVPLYRRRGDKAFVALCLAEVAVVLLAASGLIGGGH